MGLRLAAVCAGKKPKTTPTPAEKSKASSTIFTSTAHALPQATKYADVLRMDFERRVAPDLIAETRRHMQPPCSC